jgi:hypothetical protein
LQFVVGEVQVRRRGRRRRGKMREEERRDPVTDL